MSGIRPTIWARCLSPSHWSRWLPASIGDLLAGKEPKVEVVDWTSLQRDLAGRGLLDRPGLVVGALRWTDAGKIDYAVSKRLIGSAGWSGLGRRKTRPSQNETGDFEQQRARVAACLLPRGLR